MRKNTARFSAGFGRFLILLLLIGILATCFTGCFQYDPLGKENESSAPAFDPDGDDEPDQPTDATEATNPTDATDSTESTTGGVSTKPTEDTDATEATQPTQPTQPATQPTEATEATKPTQATQPTYADPIAYGMVTADELNIRQGPGTNYTDVGSLYFNDRVAIYARNGKWGQTKNGWISLGYVYIDGTPGNVTDGAATITGDYVNVRQGPGTQYSVLRGTREGDKVTILHIVEIDGTEWGCTSNGWICMDYVELEKDKPAASEPTTGNDDNTDTGNENTGSENTGNESTGNENTGSENTGNENTGNENTGTENTGTETTTVDVTGTWINYTVTDGKLKVSKYTFKAGGRYTVSEWTYEETDESSSNLTYGGKYWKGEPSWGWDGSYSVSGSTVNFIPDEQTDASSNPYTGFVSGSTLTVNGKAFTKNA